MSEFAGQLGERIGSRRRIESSVAGGPSARPNWDQPRASDRCGTWRRRRWRNTSASQSRHRQRRRRTRSALLTCLDVRIGLLAGHWTTSLDRLWREAVRSGIGLETAWSLCTNGHQVRLVDTQRTYSRAYIQFDLQQAIDESVDVSGLLGCPSRGGLPRDRSNRRRSSCRSFRRQLATARRSIDR